LCDVGRVAVKHCFKLLSFFYIYNNNNTKFIERHNDITNVNTHRHNQPLGVGNGWVQNESSSKEWTIT